MLKYITSILMSFQVCVGFSQVGINTTSPKSCAELEIYSTTRGVILPVLTDVQMKAIASPTTGLIVYNSTKQAYYYYSGSIWAMIGTKGKLVQDANQDTKIQVEKATDEDIIRFDFGGTPNQGLINSSTVKVTGDYTIPAGKTLKIGATPFTMPSTLGAKGTVLSTDGAGNWTWVEPHGGLDVAAGIQTMHFAEALSTQQLDDKTYFTPVIPFSSMTVDTMEVYVESVTGSPTLRVAVFNAAGTCLGRSVSKTATTGLFPVPTIDDVTLDAATLYYFAIECDNYAAGTTNVTIRNDNGSVNPFSRNDTSNLDGTSMGTPVSTGVTVWIAAF